MTTQQRIISKNRFRTLKTHGQARRLVSQVTGEPKDQILIDTVVPSKEGRKITFRIKGNPQIQTLKF